MKLGMRGIKCIALCVIVLFCARQMQKAAHGKPNQSIVVYVDPLLAPEAQKNIAQFTQEKNSLEVPTYKDFAQLLVQQFPCIKSVEIEKNASGLLCYSYEAAMPKIIINNDLVLTDCGTLVSKNNFAEHYIQSLHNITVSSASISSGLSGRISSLTNDFLSAYDVCWISDQEVVLKDKRQAGFTIVCDVQSISNTSALQKCTAIKNELVSDGSLFGSDLNNNTSTKKIKKIPQSWIADIRFKNQIIVSSDHGGRGYG